MSTKLVVKLASVTVAVAFASANVPLGSPAVSVSILTHKFTQGLTYFLSDSFNVVAAVQVQNTGIAILVLSATSPIACTDVALAKVTISSTNTLSPASPSSHRKYVSLSTNASTHSAKTASLSINPDANCQLAFNAGNLFSSATPLLVFTTLFGFMNSLAQVSHIATLVPTCVVVASSDIPATVSLANGGGVPISKSSHCAVASL